MAVASNCVRSVNARFLNAGEEHLKTLTSLRDYVNIGLVSLQEAVKPLSESHLLDDVESYVWTLTTNSRQPSDGLTPDESAAIHLYTLEWNSDQRSLYSTLHETLRLENRDNLKPWFFYLKLIFTALFKLPSVRSTVWRGVCADLRSKYQKDKCVTWRGFSSCTASLEVLQLDQYLGASGTRTIFSIECINGKRIRAHSSYQMEDEILLLPGTYLKVISQLSQEDDLHIIYLREVRPPHILPEPPFDTSSTPCMASISSKKATPIAAGKKN